MRRHAPPPLRAVDGRPSTRRSGPGLAGAVTRLAAAVLLVGGTAVLPVVVWRALGGPGAVDWQRVVRSGRVDGDTVVALGLVVFTLLWAWFALTAISEVARVLAWRRVPTAVLPVIEPTPTGAVRRLVRAALVSTSTVVGASVASLSGAMAAGAGLVPPTSPAVEVATAAAADVDQAESGGRVDPGTMVRRSPAVPDTVRSSGRDTPYSVAARLGDPGLRDRIIELNRGARTPTGGTWTGGVFPVGMTVTVPAGALRDDTVTWTPYTVVEGDSVYRIATRLAAGDHRRVRDVADLIIDRNLGRTMTDGKVFDDPSLVRIGWVLDVPATGTTSTSGAAAAGSVIAHVVDRGESYWSIAEDHVADHTDTAAVAELAHELVVHNAPLLGHDLPEMLHPGDVVEVVAQVVVEEGNGDPAAAAIDTGAAAEADTAADPPRPDVVIRPVVPAAEATPPAVAPSTSSIATPSASTSSNTAPVGSDPGATDATDTTDTTDATDASPAATDAELRSGRAPVTTSLAAGVLVCAGALGLVESRRRQQLRRAGTGARAVVPDVRVQQTERLVRSLDATQRAVRLDLALRSVGHVLVGTGGYVLAAILTSDGAVTVILDRPGRQPADGWMPGSTPDRWLLPAGVDDDELARTARLAGQPCPALVHLGRVAVDDGRPGEGDLFVDLEAFGLVCLDAAATDTAHTDAADVTENADAADAVLRAIAASLAVSPVGETLRLITHGLDPAVHLGNLNAEWAPDFDVALDLAASALGSTPTAIGHRRTFELRSRGTGGEAWEPVVVVSDVDVLEPSALRELVDVTRGGGRGLAVVLRHAVEGASLTVRAHATGWDLERLGITVVPIGLEAAHVSDLSGLLHAADHPMIEVMAGDVAVVELPAAPTLAVASRTSSRRHGRRDPDTPDAPDAQPIEPWHEPEWSLMVRVLGGVDIVDRDGRVVAFERGKSLELSVWLAHHRDHSTRGAARAALWEHEVRDATFANIVSDARRSLGRALPPSHDEEWIGRTLTDHLPLHPLVRTDAELLQARLVASAGLPPAAAIELLRPGLALVREQPFAGTDYAWPATEGLASALTLLVTSAATELATHHLALGDIDGVFWATGQGLKVLSGQEDLIGLRMRAHAQNGDLAGVRREWETYERAITAETWSDGEPSPKLLTLRRELLNR